MAHVAMPMKDSTVDGRVANLRKSVLPNHPFRVGAVDTGGNPRHFARCRQCGQSGEDTCFCYAHNTFISRGELTVYPHAIEVTPLLKTSTTPNINGTSKGGKKMTLDAYKSRLKNAATGSASPANLPNKESNNTSTNLPQQKQVHDTHPDMDDFNEQRPSKKPKLSPPHENTNLHPESKRKISSNQATSESRLPPTVTAKPRTTSIASTDQRLIEIDVQTKTKHILSPQQDRPSLSQMSPPTHHTKPSNMNGKGRNKVSHATTTSTQPQKEPLELKESRQLVKHADREVPSDVRPSLSGKKPPGPTPKTLSGSKKEFESPRQKSDESRTKDFPDDTLPKLMSPLPDTINRIIDEYERKLAIREVKQLNSDDSDDTSASSTKKHAKNVSNSVDERTKRESSSNKLAKKESGKKSYESLNVVGTSIRQNNGGRVTTAQKEPSKRLPESSITRTSSLGSKSYSNRAPKLMVKLTYSLRNVRKVNRILNSIVDSNACEECQNLPANNQLDAVHDSRSPRSLTSFKSPATRVNQASKPQILTPNRKLPLKQEPLSSTLASKTNTSLSNNDAGIIDQSDTDALRADVDNYLNLGIKLKHETDKALGMKTSDEVNILKGPIYAVHCIISYMISFALEDELRKREKRSPSEGWKQVVTYIEFLLTSRLRANKPLHGLLYQLGAICTDRVIVLEQQRLTNIHIPEDAATLDQNILHHINKTRQSLGHASRLTREWWFNGHQRFPYSTIEEDFAHAWSKRSQKVVRQQHISPGSYLLPFYLPLFTGSTPLEAASFAWYVTDEWCKRQGLVLNTGLRLKEKFET